MTVGLQVSRLIDISVNLEPNAAQQPSVTTALFLGSSDVINVSQRYRSYTDITDVADDFGTSAPEYLAAQLFFEQSPQPEQLYIGRWAQTATKGLLVGGILTAAQQLITAWNTINNGSFHITVDGGGPVSITALDFTAQTNMNGVATVIATALAGHGATCTWDGQQFLFESNSTGAASTIAFLTAGAGGTDISAQVKGTLATGAQEVNGIAAESALAAVTLFDDLPINFYMLMFAVNPVLDDSDAEAVAAYVEADAIPHYFGVNTQDTNALSAAATSDIGYILQQLGYERTGYQYSSTTLYPMASYFGRMATINFDAANTALELMYKQEPGVTPELLLASQANALNGKNYNYYATFNNGIPIIVNGCSANGFFTDEVQNADWLVGRVRTDLFNLLFQTPTKIPQTDAGIHTLVTTINASLNAGVNNGVIGPGTWDFDGFGTLQDGQYLETGFYVFVPGIASQPAADRLARKSPPIQIAVIFAGAVQLVAATITVKR